MSGPAGKEKGNVDVALVVPLGLLCLIVLLNLLGFAWARAIVAYLKELTP